MSQEVTPEAKHRFDVFCQRANLTMLHVIDEDRFNHFVVASYRENNRVSDLAERLREAGFDDKHAVELESYYDNALRLLEQFEQGF